MHSKHPFPLKLLPFLLFFATPCLQGVRQDALHSVFLSLDPQSIAENLAYYDLYPHTAEGKLALKRAFSLLAPGETDPRLITSSLSVGMNVDWLVALVNQNDLNANFQLKPEELALAELLAKPLKRYKKKGSTIWNEEQLLALAEEEIDLARGLLIAQYGFDETKQDAVLRYEAMLDLMALQIKARLPINATDIDKIKEMNKFIFHEMQFRFPPHSIHAQDIDLYTFLPSVLDGRQGVCLGVSILYLCLAERLNLPMEIITPPGHIYVRYRKDKTLINIETTARGIHVPSDAYLGINTKKLQTRTKKEVIGLAFVNQASVLWGQDKHQEAIDLYHIALKYMPHDPLIEMFLGFNYLFVGKVKEGKKLLERLDNYTFDYAVAKETIPHDYLKGYCNADAIKAIFMSVDETRDSILAKEHQLQQIVAKFPKFRAGILQLASTYLQLGRTKEALCSLNVYHKLDPENCIVEYYLTAIYLHRMNYKKAWQHFAVTQTLLQKGGHNPKLLNNIKTELKIESFK